jgi:hypothetical protein
VKDERTGLVCKWSTAHLKSGDANLAFQEKSKMVQASSQEVEETSMHLDDKNCETFTILKYLATKGFNGTLYVQLATSATKVAEQAFALENYS